MTFKALMLTATVAMIAAAPAMANDTPVAPPAAQKSTMAHHHMHGGHPMPPPPMMFFDKMDTNHDGVVTKKEWMDDAAGKFADIDANHDGRITKPEMMQFHKYMEQHHPEWAHHQPTDHGLVREDRPDVSHTNVYHREYYGDNRPNLAAPSASTSAPPAYNEVDPTRRAAGADGAGGWTAQ